MVSWKTLETNPRNRLAKFQFAKLDTNSVTIRKNIRRSSGHLTSFFIKPRNTFNNFSKYEILVLFLARSKGTVLWGKNVEVHLSANVREAIHTGTPTPHLPMNAEGLLLSASCKRQTSCRRTNLRSAAVDPGHLTLTNNTSSRARSAVITGAAAKKRLSKIAPDTICINRNRVS
ncbi:hypothetical protein Zmor_023936 [Zophobas morio]|uniref:Uncharacterized protein n=1 Tax=Zophobas morio TaxID=2755281 RepID=A0AA38HY19_9CUCU|nr:hypothetical protein Zmor_023936 [Zophobas morio]